VSADCTIPLGRLADGQPSGIDRRDKLGRAVVDDVFRLLVGLAVPEASLIGGKVAGLAFGHRWKIFHIWQRVPPNTVPLAQFRLNRPADFHVFVNRDATMRHHQPPTDRRHDLAPPHQRG